MKVGDVVKIVEQINVFTDVFEVGSLCVITDTRGEVSSYPYVVRFFDGRIISVASYEIDKVEP
jgi:hypothetical protein